MTKLFPKRTRRKLLTLAIGLLITLITAFAQQQGWLNSIEQVEPGYYRITEFADGDTITVDMNGKKETIRFIGVDTPETHDPRKAVQCFGAAASEFTKNLIGTHDVRLESDPTNTNRDRYNRLLRYVYLPDSTLVNLEIVKQGYGFAYTSFPFTKMDEFIAAQKTAREKNMGLWGSCAPVSNQYGGFTSNDAE